MKIENHNPPLTLSGSACFCGNAVRVWAYGMVVQPYCYLDRAPSCLLDLGLINNGSKIFNLFNLHAPFAPFICPVFPKFKRNLHRALETRLFTWSENSPANEPFWSSPKSPIRTWSLLVWFNRPVPLLPGTTMRPGPDSLPLSGAARGSPSQDPWCSPQMHIRPGTIAIL